MSENTINETFDAIVVGTGISGGWAAKELCEKGLKTLVLERGRMVNHVIDYPHMHLDPWDLPHAGEMTAETKAKYPKQSRWKIDETTRHFFNDDSEYDYQEAKRFDWIRGTQVGGRSLIWGKQTYRWSDLDFEANAKDGIGVDWPIRYKDIEPWYEYVEKHVGISGEALGLPHLPDSIFLKPMELNCVEEHLKNGIEKNYSDRVLTIGRVAHITEGSKPGAGRGTCQYRNRCKRGCPYGAYFSSNSSTIPMAEATGNMTLRPDSIVTEVLYDKDRKKATGVRIIDRNTKEVLEFKAKVIFLCASSMASTAILMQSKSETFPNGMGNASGELGHNIMDHQLGGGASAKIDGYDDKYYKGRRPNGFYIPRFRNINSNSEKTDFIRGYGYQGGASRNDYGTVIPEYNYGVKFKEAMLEPGGWRINLGGFGEVLPYHENHMWLNYDKLDQYGLPTIVFDAEFKENEKLMKEDWIIQAQEMLETSGFKDVRANKRDSYMGGGIHEMGTARMGHDPKTSILNKHNQLHEVKNVYVTDGACMASSANQNPSLTYMALTARAANHAVEELKKRNL
ncbi:choline dehydrogenase-like flavoprotein [Maribacter spongiicola]|uniref:Choline dehydrogenase-like flavoprotein n=1 Tax=Maribacter spongiicola TaxID=1206753 RepID=A0A4V3ESI9_9FLAO|nr:GMC family oxidoreductase [Maribacter spongiicola]TDT47353.1 choline dehydrogenase-like flavoprotein [Maribacter spongiicola]